MPDTTVISIGHRSTLVPFHRRRLALERDGEQFRMGEPAQNPAAE